MKSSNIWAFFFIIESFKYFKNPVESYLVCLHMTKLGLSRQKEGTRSSLKPPLSADKSFVEGAVTTKVTEESEKPAYRLKADKFMLILRCQMSHCNACTQIN